MGFTRIARLEYPTDAQIEEMSQLSAEAFENTIMNRSMTAGIKELREGFFRLVFRTAALEGKIYICQEISSGKILSLAAGYGPGNRFLGSEAQRSLGFNEFFSKLPEDTRAWWNENLLKPKKGPVNEQVQRALRLITVATLGDEQRKGYASALLKEITRTAGTPICVNVNTDVNILFYKRLGFDIVGTSEMTSSWGSWVGKTMVWEDSE